MAISKLSKIIIVSLIIISIIFTCNKIYKKQNVFENKQNEEIAECRSNPLVALTYFTISVSQYDKNEIVDLKAAILRKGKVIKTFSQKNNSQNYISFEFDQILITDTIVVRLKKDVFYIHSFKNNFWDKSKPKECYLEEYKINNSTISGIRQSAFVLKKEYL